MGDKILLAPEILHFSHRICGLQDKFHFHREAVWIYMYFPDKETDMRTNRLPRSRSTRMIHYAFGKMPPQITQRIVRTFWSVRGTTDVHGQTATHIVASLVVRRRIESHETLRVSRVCKKWQQSDVLCLWKLVSMMRPAEAKFLADLGVWGGLRALKVSKSGLTLAEIQLWPSL